MDPISVAVRRNGIVEAVHRVHAVAVAEGLVLESAGDPGLVTYTRSSSKPIQALPLVRERPDLDDRDLAIASASHVATAEQIEAVLHLLAAAPADQEELECGLQEGRPQQRLYHNCSGKHAGMLALCRARGWPSQGYRLPEHPVQQACRDVHAEAAEVDPGELSTATDGCGIVTFALTLERMAHAFSRLESLPGGGRVAAAMRGRPDLVGGPDGADYLLMRSAPRWIAKVGAEGLICAAGAEGLGVALKAEDGASHANAPALAAFLGPLGAELPELAERPILDTRGELVGAIAPRS
jgi:L-asparaginase